MIFSHCFLGCIADKSKSKSKSPLVVKKQSSVKETKISSSGSGRIAAQTFTFRELAVATKNFRADCLLGEGGFGRVYKGRLEGSNQVSACHVFDPLFTSFDLANQYL